MGRGYYVSSGNRVYEPSTKKYDPSVGIIMPKTVTTFFTIRAKTVMDDGRLADSNVTTFPFQLPAPVQAVYASPGDTSAVLSGTQVTLRCSTEGATIFYKLYSKAPAEDDIPVANLSPSFNSPISITTDTYIKAIAVKEGMESAVASYHYKVAPTLSPPTSTLSTGSVVAKGTRISLNCSASVAYTTDGTDPKAILNQTASDKDDKSTVQYGNSIIVTGDYGDSVTIRAFAYGNGYTPSETVSFSYTIAEKDDYLKTSPAPGTVVREGDTISLITGVSNASIFYTVNGASPVVFNSYLGNNSEDDY